jgi:hypothetical protein
LQLKQGGRVLYEKKIGWLKANVALSLSGECIRRVNYAGGPVQLVVTP